MLAIKMSGMKSKSKSDAFGEQEVIQAVVVADSFNVRFAPLTANKPRALLPLVNRPMLDYTLEYLQDSGVQEVFVLCCAFSQQIKEHLKKSSWSSESCPMSVTAIVSESYMSLGDTLRELDAKGLIRSDFILINGNVVSNLPLIDILQAHKKQTERDKGTILTMVFRKALPKHRTRCKEDEAFVCIEPNTQRVFHYQKIAKLKRIQLPKDLFQEHKEVILHRNILDCHISICSKHVPTLFVDNFDFQTRDDFVKGILINEEILGNSIYISIFENGYAAKVSDLIMYDSISRDIIQRWSYPAVPDMKTNNSSYNYLRHNVYMEKDVDLARACILEKNVVVGRNTKIGSNTSISNSVLGDNCIIGANVTIEGSYIWDGVRIENDCKLNGCLLATNVFLKSGCEVFPGAVLAENVIIGPNVLVKEGTRWQSEPLIEEDAFSNEKRITNSSDPISDVDVECAFLYTHSAGSDGEDEDEPSLWGRNVDSENEEADESDGDESLTDGESLQESSPIPDDTRLFYVEVLDSLLRGVEENIKCDNLVLEINSSKYAYNMTMKEVNSLLMKAILEIPEHQLTETELSTQDYVKSVEPLLEQLLPLIRNYIRSEESQIDCLIALEEYSLGNEIFSPVLIKVLKFLYDNDVLEEEILISWYVKPPQLNDYPKEKQKEIRKKVKRFIDWLKEAEEESEESSGSQ